MSEHSLPILVVEDDASLREAIGDTLELAGRPYVAVDGGEAVRSFNTDYQMAAISMRSMVWGV